MIDNKALRILFDTYWFKGGWVENPSVSRQDFEYAKNLGYMFDEQQLSHDEILIWLNKSLKSVHLEDVSNAFLASLSTRRLDLRSGVGSFSIALCFPAHKFCGKNYCNICGAIKKSYKIDLNLLNFERHKWGGIRHLNPEYIAFDLECFARLDKVAPKKEDFGIMSQIIEVIKQCDNDTKPNDLEKKLKKVFQSNKDERRVLIEILAYCGILNPKGYDSFFDKFINYSDRQIPSVAKIDWTYPICWWKGIDGINQDALNYYFPQIV